MNHTIRTRLPHVGHEKLGQGYHCVRTSLSRSRAMLIMTSPVFSLVRNLCLLAFKAKFGLSFGSRTLLHPLRIACLALQRLDRRIAASYQIGLPVNHSSTRDDTFRHRSRNENGRPDKTGDRLVSTMTLLYPSVMPRLSVG